MKTYHAFLSHSNPDKSLVVDIANWLKHNNLTVWLVKWNILPGNSGKKKLKRRWMLQRLVWCFG